jgi:molybdopterin/thiamine biosynthesis adenylyltransferase
VTNELSDLERERYASQIEGELGLDGQLVLKRARAIVIGTGPAGSTAAAELVSRGVGYVAVADGDVVSLRDLTGQALYYTPDVGMGRADTLAAKLSLLNPEVQVDSYPVAPDAGNAGAIVDGHDLVLICTPDPEVAAAVEEACRAAGQSVSSAPAESAAAGAALGAEVVMRLARTLEQETHA